MGDETDNDFDIEDSDELDLQHPTVRKLLAAAAAEFSDPEYGLLNGVQVSRIAQRAGVSEPQARRYFRVQELRDEVVRYLLDPRGDDSGSWDDNFFGHIEDAFMDRTAPLADTVAEVMTWVVDLNRADPRTRTQMALMAYASGNDIIQESMSALYQAWFVQVRNIVNEFVATHSELVRLRRDWISPIDFGYVALVLGDGFAMHSYLHQAGDAVSNSFDPELPGRVFKAVFASMFEFVDDSSFIIDEFFKRLDAARVAGIAGSQPSMPGLRPWQQGPA